MKLFKKMKLFLLVLFVLILKSSDCFNLDSNFDKNSQLVKPLQDDAENYFSNSFVIRKNTINVE